jgi:hypothetical protein
MRTRAAYGRVAALLVAVLGMHFVACGGRRTVAPPSEMEEDAGDRDTPGTGPDGGTPAEPPPSEPPAPPSPPSEPPRAAALVALRVELSSPRAAVGTAVFVTVLGTFGDGSSRELTDLKRLRLAVSADLVAVPTRAIGGLALGTVAPGTTAVTVTDVESGLSASAELVVTDARIEELRVAAPAKLAKGLVLRPSVVGRFDDGSEQDLTLVVLWRLTPSQLVEQLDGPGNQNAFRTLQQGNITAEAIFDGKRAEAQVAIEAPEIVSLLFDSPPEAIALRTTAKLVVKATLTDDSVVNVGPGAATWSSSNPAVLTVDNDGLVTAVGAGEATITVAVASGVSAGITLTVGEPAVERLRLEFADADPANPALEVVEGKTRQLLLKGVRSDGSVVDLTPLAEWTSSDARVLGVDNGKAKGLLTAKATGQARITAELPDRGPIELDVTVRKP